MFIIEGIKDHLPFFFIFHKPHISEDSQLMGYCRLRCPQKIGNIAYTEFLLRQCKYYLCSCKVSENFKCFSNSLYSSLIFHLFFDRKYSLFVNVSYFAKCCLPSFHLKISPVTTALIVRCSKYNKVSMKQYLYCPFY